MNQKVKLSSGVVTITDKHYKAAGGEAAIYVNGGKAFKLYHDPATKQLPLKKMQELAAIGNSQVIIPQEIIYDPTTTKPLGYITSYVDDVEPLLKLFNRAFKDAENISFQMVNELVTQMQLVVTDVHKADCLIVDLNELNVLARVEPSKVIPFFIDTDSYSTPSFKATAIMDSVRDRRVSITDKQGVLHYNPDKESDWFSWSILAFWLYTNIHPYRGNHPNYKPKDKQKQMDDGISVFHKDVRTPVTVNPFKVIPSRHLDWFERVFLKGERGVPPLANSSIPLLVPTQMVTITGNDKIDVTEISAYTDAVTSVYQFMGIYYVTTKTKVYANKKEIGNYKAKKALLCCANDGTLIMATQNGNSITFGEMTSATPIGTIKSEDMFARNGCIYTVANSKLIENSFTSFSGKMIHRATELENISANSAKMYDGCVIQDLLGKKYLTLPYQKGNSFSKYIPQLDGFRVLSAKADKHIVVVMAEKGGIYYRFIFIFNKTYTDVQVREVKDVTYDEINFAVMDNGVCVLLASDTELELFAKADKCEVMSNPPFDSSMKLFTTSDGIFFINGNSIHQIKKK
jgi:hypothetical protein